MSPFHLLPSLCLQPIRALHFLLLFQTPLQTPMCLSLPLPLLVLVHYPMRLLVQKLLLQAWLRLCFCLPHSRIRFEKSRVEEGVGESPAVSPPRLVCRSPCPSVCPRPHHKLRHQSLLSVVEHHIIIGETCRILPRLIKFSQMKLVSS
uniref:Uncharacterized protein n=1 Tax=Cacopsylla melanoneura TaxID=428564 RepID=A0A8D8TK54_9HEMI